MFVLGLLGWEKYRTLWSKVFGGYKLSFAHTAVAAYPICIYVFDLSAQRMFECCSEPNVRAGKREDR